MKLLSIILIASLMGCIWCVPTFHAIRDGLHSKLYGHGLHGNHHSAPVISINNQQQLQQSSNHLHGGAAAGYGIQNGYQGSYGHHGLNTGYSHMDGGYDGLHSNIVPAVSSASSSAASSSVYGGSASSSSISSGNAVISPWNTRF